MKNSFKIKIYSRGGQRVKSMVESLENFPGFFLTTLVKYDGIISGGMVETNIVLSKKKKVSPFFEKANLCIFLTKVEKPIKADEYLKVSDVSEIDLKEKLFAVI